MYALVSDVLVLSPNHEASQLTPVDGQVVQIILFDYRDYSHTSFSIKLNCAAEHINRDSCAQLNVILKQ